MGKSYRLSTPVEDTRTTRPESIRMESVNEPAYVNLPSLYANPALIVNDNEKKRPLGDNGAVSVIDAEPNGSKAKKNGVHAAASSSSSSSSSSASSTSEHKEEEKKAVSLVGLFRFATPTESIILSFGALLMAIGGALYMMNTYVASQGLNKFYALPLNTTDVDRVQAINDISVETAIVVGIFAVATFVTLFGGMSLWLTGTSRIIKRVRSTAFNNIIRQDIAYFDLHEPGAIITCLAEDTLKMQSGMGEKMAASITWLAQIVSAIVISFLGDWLLALIAFALLPVTFIAAGLTARYVRRLAQLQFGAFGEAGNVAEETMSAMRVVQAFSGEKTQVARYETKLEKARAIAQKAGLAIAGGNGIAQFIVYTVVCLVFWVGGHRYNIGLLQDPGALIQVTISGANFTRCLSWVAANGEFISSARAAAWGLYKLIDAKTQIDSLDPSGDKPKEVKGDVTFEDIHFVYPSRRDALVLQGLTLHIPHGKNVALVGPSGCGKSTTIQLLQRYYDPDRGTVKLDGKDIRDLNVKWLRSQIGVVSQDPILFATTVEDNIRFGRPDATRAEIEQVAKEAKAHEFILKLANGYETMLNSAATLLSRGEKQRISLARALLREPKILLLDECTSALDTESEVAVQIALDEAARGRTTITIAHRLSTVRNCDTLYIINEGVLWEQGTHDELMDMPDGLYRVLALNQMKGGGDKEEEEEEKTEVNRPRADSIVSTKSALSDLEDYIEEKMDQERMPPASLKRIMSLNKPETPYLVIGSIASVFMGFGFPAISIVIGELFRMFNTDDVEEQRDILMTMSPILLAIAVVVGLSAFTAFGTMKYAGEHLTKRARLLTFQSITRQEIGWFDRKENSVGALTSKLANEASMVQSATGTVLVATFSAVSTLVGATVIGLVYGWELGLPLLAYTPLTIMITVLQTLITTKMSEWTAKATREGGKIVAETIDKIRVVASLTKEDFFEESFNEFFNSMDKIDRKKATVGGAAWGATYALMGCAFLIAFPFGFWLVGQGRISPENIVRIMVGVAGSTVELGRLNSYAMEFSRARSAAAVLFQIMDRVSSIDPYAPGGKAPAESTGELAIRDAVFSYPSRPELKVLKHLSLEVRRGQFIAMCGPSGSGKTTVIQLFERFYETLSGDVLIDGHPMSELNTQWARKLMGFVTQDPMLFNISMADNIAFGDNTREVPMQEIIQAAKDANIHTFIASLPDGYNTPAGTKGTQLSGGQKQRVSIARALVRNPKILLLDDATSALDSESEKVVEAALRKAREGRTSIVVSHRLSSILHADTIYYVDRGTILEKGTHSELLHRRSHYFNLYQASMGMSD